MKGKRRGFSVPTFGVNGCPAAPKMMVFSSERTPVVTVPKPHSTGESVKKAQTSRNVSQPLTPTKSRRQAKYASRTYFKGPLDVITAGVTFGCHHCSDGVLLLFNFFFLRVLLSIFAASFVFLAREFPFFFTFQMKKEAYLQVVKSWPTDKNGHRLLAVKTIRSNYCL